MLDGDGFQELANTRLNEIQLYKPNAKLQIGGCAISSVNCRLTVVAQAPPVLTLPPLAPIVSAPEDDFDLLLPGVSDQEY